MLFQTSYTSIFAPNSIFEYYKNTYFNECSYDLTFINSERVKCIACPKEYEESVKNHTINFIFNTDIISIPIRYSITSKYDSRLTYIQLQLVTSESNV